MQWDPTRWLVSLAGFVYDWIITREWSRALLCWLPLFLLGGIALATASGNWRDRNHLAQWYLDLGNEEIAEWEQAWAPQAVSAQTIGQVEANGASTAQETSLPSDGSSETQSDSANGRSEENSATEKEDPDKTTPVSRFAETLFRRVQLLMPSERSQFVIAATLAQRGAVDQAQTMLAKVAPDNAQGYAPAHTLVARLLLVEMTKTSQAAFEELKRRLKHHIWEARRWNRCPQAVLQAGSDLFWLDGERDKSLALLSNSAERHPDDNFPLAQRAQMCGDQRQFEHAWPKAEQYLKSVLAGDSKDVNTRLRLAQTYAMAGNFDRCEEVLREVPLAERTPEITRALSQVYLMRYGQSQSLAKDKLTVNLQFLEMAMREDPTNPYVAEEVAKLARMQGPTPSEEMIEHLKSKLAEGTATAVTHACLAEMRLIRKELELAIPHLEQIIGRLPNSAEYLNNLAYCLAELHPERFEEALGYATLAVTESKQQPKADYYDTLSHVLSRLDRHKEAITAIETAIELDRRRSDFHERAAAEYRAVGDESMAQIHLGVIERLKIEEAERIEAERLAAERRAAEEKLEAERQAAERAKVEQLEAIRYASEQALAVMTEEVARERKEKQKEKEIREKENREKGDGAESDKAVEADSATP